MTTQLDPFETRLLAELRSHVAERSAVPDPAPPRRRTTSWWLGGLATAAAASVAAVVIVPGLGSTPAYSVQEGNAGEIQVEINRPEDAAGLERALEEHGIAADITYLPELQTCAPGRYTPVDRPIPGLTVGIGEDVVEITVPPGAVREGETIVMAWAVESLMPVVPANGDTEAPGYASAVDVNVAEGTVKPCEPLPAG